MTTDHEDFAEYLVQEHLAHLLADAPVLRRATVELTAAALAEFADDLLSEQLDHLRGPGSQRIPDAYLACEAAVNDSLQHAAAGLRSAMAQTSTLTDPHDFERAWTDFLSDDDHLSVRAEHARVPRPATRPDALTWSLTSAPWFSERDTDDAWPPPGIKSVTRLRSLPGDPPPFAEVSDGPHAGWLQIGLAEAHQTPARSYPAQPGRKVLIIAGLEVVDAAPPAGSAPFTDAPWQLWTVPWDELGIGAEQQLPPGGFPAAAVTNGGRSARRGGNNGLGLPLFLLAPAPCLLPVLGLRPTSESFSGFSLSDSDGPGVVCRQWREHLVHDGNYEPLTPAVEGCDLILRPDLLVKLQELAAPRRLQVGVDVSFRSMSSDLDAGQVD
ncbi:hypothetical protein BS329_17880 [Amycolatopsis coloradensis]|uniref:Uncharacterized protein n=1 Tax=Amycolatopsis coloradensis TaxID=76021 RepID=A0A1R0KT00_9PSEU|nr:hypothetical protein [Amycolatopsis coloradensis]OLZ51111.1 hypothetical protein BS329_17880 [Amycolatopsis coloradensis]